VSESVAAAKAARRRATLAEGWHFNPQLEALDNMSRTRPDQYDAMAPNLKMSLGYYKQAKAEAEAAGHDTTPPTAA